MSEPTPLPHLDTGRNELADVGSIPPADEGVLAGFFEWFRSMLQVFLVVYATVLAATATLFRGGAVRRAFVVPALALPVLLALRGAVVRRSVVRAVRRGKPLAPAVLIATGSAALSLWLALLPAVHGIADGAIADHLGPVDELLVAASPEARLESLAAIERSRSDLALAQRTGLYDIRDTVDSQLTFASTAVFASAGGRVVAADALEIDQDQARSFGGNVQATGLGTAPPIGSDAVDVGADLAADLALRPGSSVELRAGVSNARFTVRRVLPRRGLAALSLDGTIRPRVVLVEPGRLSVHAEEAGARTRYLIAFSNRGSAKQAWKRSKQVTATLAAALESPTPSGNRIAAVAVATSGDMHDAVGRATSRAIAWLRVAQGLFSLAACSLIVLAVTARVRQRDADRTSIEAAGVDRRTSTAIVMGEMSFLALTGSLVGAFAAPLIGRFVQPGNAGHTPGVLHATLNLRGTVVPGLVASFAIASLAGRVALLTGSRRDRDIRRHRIVGFVGRLGRWNRALLVIVASVAAVLLTLHGAVSRGMIALLIGAAILLVITTTLTGRRRPRLGRLTSVVGSVLLIGVALAVLASRPSSQRDSAPHPFLSGIVTAATAVAVAVLLAARLRRQPGASAITETRTDSTGAPRRATERKAPLSLGPISRWSDVARAASLAFTVAGTGVLSVIGTNSQPERRADSSLVVARGLTSEQLAAVRREPAVAEVLAVRSRVASVTTGFGAPVLVDVGSRGEGTLGERDATSVGGPFAEASAILDDRVLEAETTAIVSVTLRDRLGRRVVPGQTLQVVDATTGLRTTVNIARIVAAVPGVPEIVVSRSLLNELPERRDDVLSVLVRTSDRVRTVRAVEPLGVRLGDTAAISPARPSAESTFRSLLHRLLLVAPALAVLGLGASWGVQVADRRPEALNRRAHGSSRRATLQRFLLADVPVALAASLVGLAIAASWSRAIPGLVAVAALLIAVTGVAFAAAAMALRR